MKAKILERVKGINTSDGAGVKLVRVLSNKTVESYDPFLMLDSFDSTNYDDYKAGFPMHPHRGIETITYLSAGHVTHRDSLGNEKTIGPKSIQWMTAGSGILHSEFFDEEDRLLGLQLWLNLPRHNKMTSPSYNEVLPEDISVVNREGAKIRVYSGSLENAKSDQAKYNPLDFHAIDLNGSVTISPKEGYTVNLFTLIGDIKVNGETVEEKTSVRLSEGDVTLESDGEAEVVWMASPPLKEPVVWGGPIVMNTREELNHAFQELSKGTFLKESIQG